MPTAKLDIGTIIKNRYEIQRVLGQGGFGMTYLASNVERCGESCVLKVFVPQGVDQKSVERARMLFEREARVLYTIDHPQIPKFLAWFELDGRLFIVQEYITGKTYLRLLRENQKHDRVFSETEIIQWLNDLLPVLAYLHDNHILHRDISPDNIMLPNMGSKPVLIDFGLVKQKVSQIWSSAPSLGHDSERLSFVGKFGYSPPEQIRMGQCFPCSDLYALAVTAIVLLTGKEPLDLMDQRSLEWRWDQFIRMETSLPSILTKMLAEKPKDRFQNACDIIPLLQNLSSSNGNPPLNPYSLLNFEAFDAPPPPKSNIPPEFVLLCHQQLTLYIGPIAKFIVEETLADSPAISADELIDALAAEIPNPQQAHEFRMRLKLNHSM